MPRLQPPPVLGTVLTFLRVVQGWAQNELAAALGVRPPVVCDYEAGRRNLSRKRLNEIAAVLGLPPEAVDCALAAVRDIRSFASPLGGPAVHDPRTEAAVAQVTAAAQAFARSVVAIPPARQAEEDRRQARVLWERMKRHPPARRRSLVEHALEFRTWALCELICEKSIESAADSAERALDLAGLAVRIAELLPAEVTWRHRLQGYALAHLANAKRVAGDLAAADEIFARSRSLSDAGASAADGLLTEAILPGLEASLRREQRRLPEALSLLDQALAADDGTFRRQLLINRAWVLEQGNHFEDAITTLRAVAPSISGENEPRLLCVVLFNLANNLLQVGRFEDAVSLLPKLRELTARNANDLDTLRFRWLEGRIAGSLGKKEEALIALSQVREDFATRKIAYDTALASLELAVLFLEKGRPGEVRLISRQILWIFQAEGVHREALAALRVFCESAEQQNVTLDLVGQIVDYLRQARNNPSLRFEGHPR